MRNAEHIPPGAATPPRRGGTPNMVKKVLVRAGIAVAAIGVAVAMFPNSSVNISRSTPVAATGATVIAFSPAANPAFKVNGFSTCASGRTGHLWVAATVTATSVAHSSTDEVVVDLGIGAQHRTYHLTKASGFTTTIPTSDNFNCSTLHGTTLPYTATSYKGGNPQSGSGATGSGSYSITKVD
jgi:hypothetical protein